MKANIGDMVKIDKNTWAEVVTISNSKFYQKTLYLVKLIGKKTTKWIAEINISEIQYALRQAIVKIKKDLVVTVITWTIGILQKGVAALSRLKNKYINSFPR